MATKRIIPCLDIKDGMTVKGVNFENLKEVGDPVEMAVGYCRQMADELVFLDIAATVEGRKTFIDLVKRLAANIDLPFTVGGGIATVEDAGLLLEAGASKVSINSAAVNNPQFINNLAAKYGSKCVVAAIDAKEIDGVWKVTTHSGNKVTDKELFSWAKEVEERGAGEILFTSMNHDGTKAGYPCEVYKKLSQTVNIPIIASGGAGCMNDIVEVLSDKGGADAALAASVFHFGDVKIPELKKVLRNNDIPVRMIDINAVDFNKNGDSLVPVIIQDNYSLKVLMLGYMNKEALARTLKENRVTFYSRTKKRLWTKGETSGNFLNVCDMYLDCDNDAILVKVEAEGPVCHTGSVSCFNTEDTEGFIRTLQQVIEKRKIKRPEGSYTVKLFDKGVNKIAQKVGEEAVETVIEAIDCNDQRLIYEASDLIYHLLVLLSHKEMSISDLEKELYRRHR